MIEIKNLEEFAKHCHENRGHLSNEVGFKFTDYTNQEFPHSVTPELAYELALRDLVNEQFVESEDVEVKNLTQEEMEVWLYDFLS
jgi:hypothetical protein